MNTSHRIFQITTDDIYNDYTPLINHYLVYYILNVTGKRSLISDFFPNKPLNIDLIYVFHGTTRLKNVFQKVPNKINYWFIFEGQYFYF